MNESVEPRREAQPAAAAPAAVPATVLLVDDEPVVRTLMEAVLRSRGLEVVSATTGAEALALLERPEAARYATLVTDVVMPDLHGFEIAARFLATHPGARALLVSGSITADEALDPRFEGRADFLAKPFRAAALLQRVEEALARAAAWAASAGSRAA